MPRYHLDVQETVFNELAYPLELLIHSSKLQTLVGGPVEKSL